MSEPGNIYEVDGDMVVFRCPIVRTGTAVLNRALFNKSLPIAAAALKDNRLITKYRKPLETGREILYADRISPIASHPDKELAKQGRKCLLLNPSVKPEAPDTWGPVLKDGVQKEELTVIPYELQLDYNYWSYREVMTSILPEELHDEVPSGFNIAGHVAHLNLRENYLPYKHIVAEIILDKNPQIKTVINKVDNVGSESEFRTFQYEVLAGPDDLNVQVSESDCTFEFDYSKVYWNSKLESEHRRLINMFRPGEVVCDVMAGIGPFAVPAGKKRVFVWANDKNPESVKCLEAAIKKNKVSPFVRPFCEDGRTFIYHAADLVLEASQKGECAVLTVKAKPTTPKPAPAPTPAPTPSEPADPSRPRPRTRPATQEERVPIPPTISHFVMNLPATAIEFLSSYRGVYAGREALFAPAPASPSPSATTATTATSTSTSTSTAASTAAAAAAIPTPASPLPPLPMVHVHGFSVKATDETPALDICARISRELGFAVRPVAATATATAAEAAAAAAAALEGGVTAVGVVDGAVEEHGGEEGLVYVHRVRDVAPAKSMYCASFRLPREVAFAERG